MLSRRASQLTALSGNWRPDRGGLRVREILRDAPSGSGDFVWIELRRHDITTKQVVQAIVRTAGCKESDIKFGGTRDRRSDCIQWFSLPLESCGDGGMNVLKTTGYKSKIRVLNLHKHHRAIRHADVIGLHYDIVIEKSFADDGLARAEAIAQKLRKYGVPNYSFPRFGVDGAALSKWGRLVARGKRLPGVAHKQKVKPISCLATYQHHLSNVYISKILDQQEKHENFFLDVPIGSVMLRNLAERPQHRKQEIAADIVHEQSRIESWESILCVPMFGRYAAKDIRAEDDALAAEECFLQEQGLKRRPFERLEAGYRAAFYQPRKLQISDRGQDITMSCELDEDAFVTTLVEEFLQPERHLW